MQSLEHVELAKRLLFPIKVGIAMTEEEWFVEWPHI
jgi:hypothetical protein